MSKNTGGPAFPKARDTAFTKDSEAGSPLPGMTLRDYFAAQAMISSTSVMSWRDIGYTPENGLSEMEQNARLCYQMADAMLAERAK